MRQHSERLVSDCLRGTDMTFHPHEAPAPNPPRRSGRRIKGRLTRATDGCWAIRLLTDDLGSLNLREPA